MINTMTNSNTIGYTVTLVTGDGMGTIALYTKGNAVWIEPDDMETMVNDGMLAEACNIKCDIMDMNMDGLKSIISLIDRRAFVNMMMIIARNGRSMLDISAFDIMYVTAKMPVVGWDKLSPEAKKYVCEGLMTESAALNKSMGLSISRIVGNKTIIKEPMITPKEPKIEFANAESIMKIDGKKTT